jgi:hypothetical protein
MLTSINDLPASFSFSEDLLSISFSLSKLRSHEEATPDIRARSGGNAFSVSQFCRIL